MPAPPDRRRRRPPRPEWISDDAGGDELAGGPARARRGAVSEDGQRPGGLGIWGQWLLPLVLVVGVNLCTRQVVGPLRQLAFYCGVMGALMLAERLRHPLLRAQVLVIGGAAIFVGVTHREALLSSRLQISDAVAESAHIGTGLGRGLGDALRFSALGEPDIVPFVRYLEKVDSRSSDVVILASRLAAGCEGADHLCEASALLRFVTDDVAYRSDPRGPEDYVKSPLETLAAVAGDCEDKSILLASLLEALGNRTWLVFTRDHVWPMACFETSLIELWRQRTARASPEERAAYARMLWPRQSADEIERLITAADGVDIDGRFCYAIEPTATSSYFGAFHRAKEYLIAVDPITRKAIDLQKLGLAVTR